MGSAFGKSGCPAAAPGQPEDDLYTCHCYSLSAGSPARPETQQESASFQQIRSPAVPKQKKDQPLLYNRPAVTSVSSVPFVSPFLLGFCESVFTGGNFSPLFLKCAVWQIFRQSRFQAGRRADSAIGLPTPHFPPLLRTQTDMEVLRCIC